MHFTSWNPIKKNERAANNGHDTDVWDAAGVEQ